MSQHDDDDDDHDDDDDDDDTSANHDVAAHVLETGEQFFSKVITVYYKQLLLQNSYSKISVARN